MYLCLGLRGLASKVKGEASRLGSGWMTLVEVSVSPDSEEGPLRMAAGQARGSGLLA